MATHEQQPLLAGSTDRQHGVQGVVALVLFSLLCMLQGLSWDPWGALPGLSQSEYGFDTTILTWQQNANNIGEASLLLVAAWYSINENKRRCVA